MMKGYDLLGLAMLDARMIAKEMLPNTAIGVLEETFGDPMLNMKRLMQSGKVSAVRVHLRDGTCWRNRVCAKGTKSLDDLEHLGALAEKWEKFRVQFNIPVFMSPVLEYDEKDKRKVEKWFDVIKVKAPGCVPVQNPFSGVRISGPLLETHGNSAKGDIISNDGVSLYDADTSKYWDGGRVISFGWVNRMNLRTTGEKTFIMPKERKNKLQVQDMRQINFLMEPQASKPKGNYKEITKPQISKSNAEDYGEKDDGRGNKICLMVKDKVSKWELFSTSGEKVGCLKRFDPPFEGTLYRYYLGSCCSLNNIQLYKKAGGEWLYAKSGDKTYLINAIRRLGSYRTG